MDGHGVEFQNRSFSLYKYKRIELPDLNGDKTSP
jgi:hypothetical protein